MSIVSAKSIELAIQKVDNLEEKALDKLIESFSQEQEELLNYVMLAGVNMKTRS